jgi:transposase
MPPNAARSPRRGSAKVTPLLDEAVAAAAAIPSGAKDMLARPGREIGCLDTRLNEREAKLTAAHKANALGQRLAAIPGAGRIIALTLASEVDAMAFGAGRTSGGLGWVDAKEPPAGGKQRMGGIGRAGNERLRRLRVTGATAAIRSATRPGDKRASAWLLKPLQHKPRKLAAVALANTMARIARATLAKVPAGRLRPVGMPEEGMMRSGESYRRPPAVAATVAA